MYQESNTPVNFQLYKMIVAGDTPVTLEEMKTYLGISNTGSDNIITSILASCVQWGQKYTAREFTDNQYTLMVDCFEETICISRNPTASIVSVEYLVSDSLVTVPASVYYLKNGTQSSEILLKSDQSWPTDGDDREQGIKITILCDAISVDTLEMAKTAIKRHVAYMFENRGDCGDCGGCAGEDQAGVKSIYSLFRIPRI